MPRCHQGEQTIGCLGCLSNQVLLPSNQIVCIKEVLKMMQNVGKLTKTLP